MVTGHKECKLSHEIHSCKFWWAKAGHWKATGEQDRQDWGGDLVVKLLRPEKLCSDPQPHRKARPVQNPNSRGCHTDFRGLLHSQQVARFIRDSRVR